LVIESLAPLLIPRLIEATASLRVLPAHDPGCQLGPVVDQVAYQRLMEIIEHPPEGAKLLYRGDVPDGGLLVPPTIFEVDDPDHWLMQTELFGPILTLLQVPTFERALEVANQSRYALTGGLYSRHPVHIEQAAQAFVVGNLYINQPCTGAKVGRQPFGGFKMSGIGTKAGGPGYLTHFADPRSVTENLTRRGFAPGLE